MSDSLLIRNNRLVQQGSPYGEEYYKNCFGPVPYERNPHWLNFFGGIADEINRSLRPKTLFDAGCAWGFLVESFRDRGVEAVGVDISEYAISNVRRDVRASCTVASLTEPIRGGPYELLTCIETLEHMPEGEAREAVYQMTRVTDTILFSSTPDDLNEPTHINVHPVIDWLRLFASRGFYPDLSFDASFLAPHAFLVRRRSEALADDVLVLFSETLRSRSDRAAFLLRHSRIEQLENDADLAKHQLAEASRTVDELRDQNREMSEVVNALFKDRDVWRQGQSDLQAAREELERTSQSMAIAEEGLREARLATALLEGVVQRSRAEGEAWRLQAEAGQAALQESRQLSTALQYQLEDARLQTARVEAIVEEWMEHCAELSHSLDQLGRRNGSLQTELESLQSSRGWRLIQRYREWMQANRFRRRWVTRLWEPTVHRALRNFNLVPTLTPRPVTSDLPPTRSLNQLRSSPAGATHPERGATHQHGNRDASDYESWIIENEPNGIQLEIQRRMGRCFSYRPLITVLIPVYKVPVDVLRAGIESVVAQTYDNWELSISVVGTENPEAATYLEKVAAADSRIRVRFLAANEGISGNSNQALEMATGEYLALLDHDDTLAPFALFEVVQLLNQDPTVNFLYSDKDQITEDGKRRLPPLFKPEESPEVMLNANYLTHLTVMRTSQVREIGGWRKETDGAQDWDLFLRLTDRFGKVRHIPKVLYHWRQIATSVSSGGLWAKPYAAEAQVRAVKAHCNEIGIKDAGVRHDNGALRIEWPLLAEDRVSVVYLSRKPDDEALTNASDLAKQTNHPGFEILVPVTVRRTDEDGRVRGIPTAEGAGLLDRIDAAVRAATGDTLVFIDECVTPTGLDWLVEITGPLKLKEVGVVGAKLLDANSRALRHCGLVFTWDGRVEYIYASQPEHVSEQLGSAAWYRNWSAVSGACLAIRREAWVAIGGLSGEILHQRLDVHLCLKVRLQTDWRILYNPYARLLQGGEAQLEASAWCESGPARHRIRTCYQEGDPYFNRNLDCESGKVIYRRRKSDGEAPRGTDYSAESQALVQFHDFAPAQIEQSRQINSRPPSGRLESITWLLPDFVNPFYGGVHTILRFADQLQRHHSIRSNICVVGDAPESRVRRQVASAFPQLAAACEVSIFNGRGPESDLPPTDAVVCSLWTTAFVSLQFERMKRRFYFIQDDEALFYPAGSTSALVEATYGFGFHGICNTISMLKRYEDRGGRGEYFDPCIDAEVFHDRGRKPIERSLPYTLFCYIRPSHSRNCFELLAASLRLLRQRMGDGLLVITAGAEWDPRDYKLDGIVQNLGLLSYRATAALYRMCDAGVVMMMTRHPSYLPMELMACGSLVITNRNPDTTWLLRDDENCLLADMSPRCLAERIEEGLMDLDVRGRLTRNASLMVQSRYSSWDEQIEKIYRYMASVC